MQRRHLLKSTILATAFALVGVGGAAFAENADKLKIGFVGVTSGPSAAWGISNVRSMETLAAWLNEVFITKNIHSARTGSLPIRHGRRFRCGRLWLKECISQQPSEQSEDGENNQVHN